MIVYVATVETYYEVMAVGSTPEEAKMLASKLALKFLRARDAVRKGETDTWQRVQEYFGVNVTELKVGTADYVGNCSGI